MLPGSLLKDKVSPLMAAVSLLVLTIFLTFFIYSFSLRGEFIWDDHILVKDNTHIKSATLVKDIFTCSWGEGAGLASNFYRPLASLSYLCDYNICGLDPYGYHRTNVLLHILVVLLIIWFMHYFVPIVPTVMAAIFYAIIPANVETVANISNRAEILCAAFVVIAMGCYIRYLDRQKVGYLIAGVVCFFLGLLAKETALLFLPLVFLYHFSFRRLVSWPILWFVAAGVIYFFWRHYIFRGPAFFFSPLPSHSAIDAMRICFSAFFGYLKIIFFPVSLHVDYMDIPNNWQDMRIYFGFILLAFFLLLGVYFYKHKKSFYAFGIFWFVAAILPFCGLYPLPFYKADHYLYLALIGGVLLLAGLISFLVSDMRFSRYLFYLVLIAAGFLSYISIKQNGYWATATGFYQRSLAFSPNSIRLRLAFGKEHFDHSRFDMAIEEFKRVVHVDPDNFKGYYNLGITYMAMGEYGLAAQALSKALSLNSGWDSERRNATLILKSLGVSI